MSPEINQINGSSCQDYCEQYNHSDIKQPDIILYLQIIGSYIPRLIRYRNTIVSGHSQGIGCRRVIFTVSCHSNRTVLFDRSILNNTRFS